MKSHPVSDPNRHLQVLASSSSTHIRLPRHSVNTFVSFFFRGRGLAELTLKYITMDKRAERLRSSGGVVQQRAGGQAPARTKAIKARRGQGSQMLQILPHFPQALGEEDAGAPVVALLAFPPLSSALCQRSSYVLTRTEATGRRGWDGAEGGFRSSRGNLGRSWLNLG